RLELQPQLPGDRPRHGAHRGAVLMRARLLALALLVAGCGGAADDGYAVRLIVIVDPSISDAALAQIRSLDVDVSGAETYQPDLASAPDGPQPDLGPPDLAARDLASPADQAHADLASPDQLAADAAVPPADGAAPDQAMPLDQSVTPPDQSVTPPDQAMTPP